MVIRRIIRKPAATSQPAHPVKPLLKKIIENAQRLRKEADVHLKTADRIFKKRGLTPPKLCMHCEQERVLFGYHCLNTLQASNPDTNGHLSNGSFPIVNKQPITFKLKDKSICNGKDHITWLCSECISGMVTRSVETEIPVSTDDSKPIIVVDVLPKNPCHRFDYMRRANLTANKNKEQEKLAHIRKLYAPPEPKKRKVS
jgi:hypothetical protein